MPKQTFIDVWRWPIVLTILIVVGLLSALLGEGIWTFISWLFLLVPLVVLLSIVFFAKRRKKTKEEI